MALCSLPEETTHQTSKPEQNHSKQTKRHSTRVSHAAGYTLSKPIASLYCVMRLQHVWQAIKPRILSNIRPQKEVHAFLLRPYG